MPSAVAVSTQTPKLVPFALKDAPSLIERQFPVARLSLEAFKERKAVQSQTLTALGSYWKGRKPLILVRAVVLGSLLPAGDDSAADLDIFLKLMAMDDDAFARRFDGSPSAFAQLFPEYADKVSEERGKRRNWRADVSDSRRRAYIAEAFATLPYAERLKHVRRPEECNETELFELIWPEVNRHLGTDARSLQELVEQLGFARFGHRPKVADTFCGGGSIPFEAARLGCEVYASDLNPVACMLTWGAFNIIGASKERRAEIEAAQNAVAAAVDTEITRLGIEHDAKGNRAKAYLYCLETRDPRTGWMVPMAPSWVISKTRNVVAKLVPDHTNKRYGIEVHSGVSAGEMAEAEQGTVRDGRLIHPMNPERSGVEIKTIRGDYKDEDGNSRNRLRLWEKSDFVPRSDDIFQERLYCIQWIAKDRVGKARQETFFAGVTDEDRARELTAEEIVRNNLSRWQSDGLVPDMPIEPGGETTRLFRERGWTHWHHLFGSRHLLILGRLKRELLLSPMPDELLLGLAKALDWANRLCYFGTGASRESISHLFANQALNPLFNYGVRPCSEILSMFVDTIGSSAPMPSAPKIVVSPAHTSLSSSDVIVTDPPYADAINYHEITEFFIAWLRKKVPQQFLNWTWDSQRHLAIKGKDEDFRREMVGAYGSMTRNMPDNGLQVVMFTHQDAAVWAELGGILWASGLQVKSAWNVVTETEKPSGNGNYVQGTVCLSLRKRIGEANARRMEIEAEIEEAVAEQLRRLNALDDTWHERTHGETLYTDGDLTLAAYAAALQVVTTYSTIDRQPLDRDLYRKLAKNERSVMRDLVDYAAQVANSLLVPQGFPRDMWRDLSPSERFYVRMLDMEAKGASKVADFQNFARSFAFGAYADLMESTTANAASLAGAADLKGRMLADNADSSEGFPASQLRHVLFAVWKTMEGGTRDPKRGVTILKTEYAADYWQRRQKLIALAAYVGLKTKRTRPEESEASNELAEALKLDRI
jgi:putative DNA methylase